MGDLINNVKPRHFIYALAGGVVLFAALNFSSQPLFNNLDQFVLVAEDKIHLTDSVQISSGDLAANKEISIAENNIISGNLFSDEIKIAENSTINGNASFNELKPAKNSQILGVTSTPISLPVIRLPAIPDFETGTQNFIIAEDQIISPGDFNKIEIKENATLTLNPGAYNLNNLELRQSSKLIFSGPTTINVKQTLRISEKALIVPNTAAIQPTDLQLNYAGNRPITIGRESFVSAKLLAPYSRINLGEQITFRGQVLAKEINVGRGSLLSRELTGVKVAKQEEIITDPGGGVYPINILLVSLTPDATFEDALKLAQSINGRIVGNVSSINLFQIEVQTRTIEELESIINTARSRADLKVDGVFRDYLLPIGV